MRGLSSTCIRAAMFQVFRFAAGVFRFCCWRSWIYFDEWLKALLPQIRRDVPHLPVPVLLLLPTVLLPAPPLGFGFFPIGFGFFPESVVVFHRLWTSLDAEMGAQASRASATGANAAIACPPLPKPPKPPKPPKLPPPGASAPMEGDAPPHAKLNNAWAWGAPSSFLGCGVMCRTSF